MNSAEPADAVLSPLPLRASAAINSWTALSGQIGGVNDVLVDGRVGPRANQALRHLACDPESHNLGLMGSRSTCTWLTWATTTPLDDVYGVAFHTQPSASTAVAVQALPLGAAVENQAWATAPNR